MKALWEAVSIVCVIHIALLAVLLGWLWRSDRLDAERVDAVRGILTARSLEGIWPPAQQVPVVEQVRVADAGPGMSSAEMLATQADEEGRRLRAMRRLEEKTRLLLEQLASESGRIEAERRDVEDARTSFEAQVAAERDRRTDEQFRKTVRLLDGLPPKQAKQHLAKLVLGGESALAAAYLDAMQIRQAQKTLAEFKTEAEVELAAQLLAHVRE